MRTSGAAISALVLAVASFVVVPFVPAVAAILVAARARRTIAASGGAVRGLNLCAIARVVAWVNLVVVAAVMLLLLPAGAR